MTRSIRRIGILTGGGDCPGLNAVIRAVTKTAIGQYGLEVMGIEDGFLGLVKDHIRAVSYDDVSNILTLGGTILGANNKCDPKRYPITEDGQTRFVDMTDQCLANLARHRIDGLIVIGGDGTMTVASHYVARGVPCVGVPKTIDNDLMGTDVTFGFATAVQVASEALDRVHSTAASHHRAMVVEVMGRNAGWIALHAGVATGADVILLPEIPFEMQVVTDFIQERRQKGRRFSILCVSEGARPVGGQQIVAKIDPLSPEPVRLGGVGQFVAEEVERITGIETRTTVLGYVQRGGTPVAQDRILATQFGHAAIEALVRGESDHMIVLRNGDLSHVPISAVANQQRTIPLDLPLLAAAHDIGTCFGAPGSSPRK